MLTRLHEAHDSLDPPAAVANEARMERGATTAFAMGVDQRADLRLHACMLKSRCNEFALPHRIGRLRQRLNCASAANGEMRTERRNTIRTRRHDFAKLATLAIDFGDDGLACQCIGHEHKSTVPARDAFATLA